MAAVLHEDAATSSVHPPTPWAAASSVHPENPWAGASSMHPLNACAPASSMRPESVWESGQGGVEISRTGRQVIVSDSGPV